MDDHSHKVDESCRKNLGPRSGVAEFSDELFMSVRRQNEKDVKLT